MFWYCFMTFICSWLKTGDKVILILPFVSSPVWELMFSSLPAAVNYSPFLLLNSAITLLKSAKCFGYSLYVGCCTKSSCVSVRRYNESTFKYHVFFSVTLVCKFGSLWVHHVDTTFYFALIFIFNFILCIVYQIHSKINTWIQSAWWLIYKQVL